MAMKWLKKKKEPEQESREETHRPAENSFEPEEVEELLQPEESAPSDAENQGCGSEIASPRRERSL